MNKKISYYIFHKEIYDLMQKFLPIIAIVYLGFFAIEAVLPGTVIEVFNINILLLLFIIDAGYLIWSERKNQNEKNRLVVRKRTAFLVFTVMIVVSLLTLFIVQYKISIIESLLYIFFAIFIGKFIKEMLGETN